MKPVSLLALAALLPACGGGSSVATRRPLPSPSATPSPSPTPTPVPSPSPTLAPAPVLTLAAPQELSFPDEPFRKDEPAAAPPRAFTPPTVQRFQLDNGIDVFLVERHTIPTVTVRLAFEGGGIQDPPGQEGLISLCVSLMTDGTEKLDKLAFEATLADLASSIGSEAGADWQTFSMSALTRNLAPTLVGPGDVVVIPAGVPQQITNVGDADLVFYCVCTPRFRPDGYESLDGGSE